LIIFKKISQVGEYERKIMKLIPRRVQMKSKTVLTQFLLSKWSIEYKDVGEYRK